MIRSLHSRHMCKASQTRIGTNARVPQMARMPRIARVHASACQTWIDVNNMNSLKGRETRSFTGKYTHTVGRFSQFKRQKKCQEIPPTVWQSSQLKRPKIIQGIRSEHMERRTPGIRTGMKSVKCVLSHVDPNLKTFKQKCLSRNPSHKPKRVEIG